MLALLEQRQCHLRGMIRRRATHPFGAALKGVQICFANLVNRA